MKALVYEGPHKMEILDYPMCEPKAGQVKIKVKYCGICGSDIHGYTGASGRKIPPMVMGHEFSGVVTELGEGVVIDLGAVLTGKVRIENVDVIEGGACECDC